MKRVPIQVVLILLVCSGVLQAAKPKVSFELVMEKGFPFSQARKWSRMFSKMRIPVTRIRSAKAGDKTNVQARGRGAAKRYFVIGALTSKGRLDLPGTTIRLGQNGKLTQWITRLQNQGIEGIASVRGAFGLTAKQLIKASERLSKKVSFKTKGMKCGECAQQIIRGVGRVAYGAGGRVGLRSSEKMIDELKGLTAGTALAASLKPIGLALVPEMSVGQLQFRVLASIKTKESWPVGWPTKKPPNRTLPVLFKFLNVKIDKIPLANALTAIQGRIDAPILYDRNRITLKRIDLDKPVSFPQKRTFYKRIIDNLLFQVKLKSELRVDEADKGFVWVTPLAR